MTGNNLSYVHGTSLEPLLGETVGRNFDRLAEAHAEREALIIPHQNVRWSYAELKRRVDCLADGLLKLGLEPGDRVGIWSPNNWQWVVTQFATAKAGLILVNINPAYRLGELDYALKKVGCSALITAPAFKSSNYIEMLAELIPKLATAGDGPLDIEAYPELRWLIRLDDESSSGMLRFSDLEARGNDDHPRRLNELATELQFDDPINIQFTSGTTGAPKASTLTHHNIVNNAHLVAEDMRLTEADRICIPVPMYHCFGMVLGTLCAVTHGAAMVLPSEGFDARATLEAIATERCTVLHGVPTMFIAELEDEKFEKYDLASLRTGVMAGAPCPVELMKRVMRDMHLKQITIAYGMTETGPVSFETAVDDPIERRVGTVGRVLPHTEVKFVDERGRIVPRGETGELLTRGYCVMPGYWNDAEKTADAIDAARWIKSGDLAVIDDEGYCQIVGRLKDMIIRGGENVFPREIEEFLFQHPKVADVQVIGVPDPKYGEELCAWIRLQEGETASEDEIREFCRGQIAHFKVPRYLKFVDDFPLTVTGKVQKYKMREIAAAELGLSSG